MRKGFTIGILLIVFLAQINGEPIGKTDFAINKNGKENSNIGFEDTFTTLFEKLGKPTEVKVSKDESDSKWDWISNYYQGLTIAGYRGWEEIYYIYLDTNDYQTKRGISIGDSKSKVLEVYGKPNYNKKFIQYYIPLSDSGGSWVLSFKFQDGKVSEIIMNLSD